VYPAIARQLAGVVTRLLANGKQLDMDHRIRSGCCARAASGQAAAPPSSVMNSRRLISSMGLFPPASRPVTFASLPEGARLIFGADLNRSELAGFRRIAHRLASALPAKFAERTVAPGFLEAVHGSCRHS
jgi:hypothetical protein